MILNIPNLTTNESLVFMNSLKKIRIDDEVHLEADMNWNRPFGLLLVSSGLREFRRINKSVPFTMTVKRNKGTSYAGHMGFFKSISDLLPIGNQPGEAEGNYNYLPITEIDVEDLHQAAIRNGHYIEMGDTIESESKRLANILSHGKREIQKILAYILTEMIRNIPEHAETNNVWICGQYWNDNSAEIAILDDGLGIIGSLRKNKIYRNYIHDDTDALKYAITAGVSESFNSEKRCSAYDIWDNSGFGLYVVSELCNLLYGSFCIASGSKYLLIKNGSEEVGDTWVKGTALGIALSTAKLSNSEKLIHDIVKAGENKASNNKNAFHFASRSSKGEHSKL